MTDHDLVEHGISFRFTLSNFSTKEFPVRFRMYYSQLKKVHQNKIKKNAFKDEELNFNVVIKLNCISLIVEDEPWNIHC